MRPSNLVGLMAVLSVSSASFCQSLVVPKPTLTTISVGTRDIVEPVNRRVMGVCLMYTPFDDALAKAFEGDLDGTSGRAWAHVLSDDHWLNFMSFVKQTGIHELNGFSSQTLMAERARYVSPSDNNLKDNQTPEAQAGLVKTLNKQPHPGWPNGYGLTGWEIWNEPQFPQSGAWPAKDYAQYVIDSAKAIHAVEPTMEIGAALHIDDVNWNRQMMRSLAALDPSLVNFVIDHPYDFFWHESQKTMGSYYSRAGGAEPVRTLKLQPMVKAAMDIGHCRWRFVCSEWTVHPQGYDPPYNTTHDMAVALNAAAMFGVFWDEHVDSAQYFELYGQKNDHFHLAAKAENGVVVNPTGEVFRLYGKYFRGDRLNVSFDSPTYPYTVPAANGGQDKTELAVPVVFSQAAHDDANNRLVIMLANRHQTESAPVDVKVSDYRPNFLHATRITLSAKEPELTEAVITTADDAEVWTGANGTVHLDLPPHSITALLIPGTIPKTEQELFGNRLDFIQKWQVGTFVASNHPDDHGLTETLPSEVTAGTQGVQAGDGGFVDMAGLLKVSGKLANLKEGYQGVANSWVFSPVAREVGLSVGFDYWGVVSINGKEALAVKERGGPPQADSHRAKVQLKAGWNQLSVRVSSGTKGMGFWMALEKKSDLLFAAQIDAPAWPSTWQVAAEQGTFVNSFVDIRKVPQPDAEALELSTRGNERKAFLQWPIQSIPKGMKIHNATIKLAQAYHKGAGNVWISAVNEEWKQETATFETAPKTDAPLSQKVNVEDPTWTFTGPDVTAMVQRWVDDPNSNHGICVESDVEDYAAFNSDKSAKPVPVLTFETDSK